MKYIIIIVLLAAILFTMIGCASIEPIEQVEAAETTPEPYTLNIDTLTQGEITYKKLVIHNHTEYDSSEEGILDQSRKLLEEVSIKQDIGEFGEISIIFYKGKNMFCVVDGTSMRISYLK